VNALADVAVASPAIGQVLKWDGTNFTNQADATGGGGISDGDKGDITVSGTGTVWTIDPATVTYAKIQNISASQRLLGRTTAGAGVAEEVSATQLLDWVGSTQGQILYRSAAGWQVLAPGSAGQVLRSGGAAADPSWLTISAGGQSSIQFQDEAINIGAAGGITTINVTGDDHAATVAGSTLTLDVKKYKRNARWAAVGNSPAIVSAESATLTNSVTPTAANVAVTDAYTEKIRTDYLQVTATTTAIATARSAAAMWYRGAAAGRGGFRVRARIGNATGSANATHRAFFGLQGGTTALTDVNPSTVLNTVGLGWDSGDANLSMITNNAVGPATKTTLGASFPRPTTDRSAMWDLELSCAANDTQIAYKVTNLISGAVATGSLTATLPVSTTYLAWHMYASAGGTSSVAGFTFSFLEIASDY
jgi:hypothetical protein